jgi:hypothetical protein
MQLWPDSEKQAAGHARLKGGINDAGDPVSY